MLAPWFALAGLCAAAGPVLIHLLNRRRYRVVDWAAMDFLREAVQRSRKFLEWRDLLLLLLRTACILLFGLALSRPFFAASGDAAAGGNGGPVHAVMVVDNSLSMAYQELNSTLLDQAKREAKAFLDRLPVGSVYSIIPTCGAGEGRVSRDVYRTRQDAIDAIDAIAAVDRSTSSAAAADLALEACKRASDHPSKRVVFIGDQQAINWPTQSLGPQFAALPEVQIVRVGPEKRENAWIDDFRLQDPVADVETAALFVATVRYEGDSPRPNIQVRLTLQDGANGKPVEVASKTIDLTPGQAVEVEFPHRFDSPVEPGQANFILATVSLPPDSLPEDDERTLTAPVLASVPVVFIDQYGSEQERPNRNQYGESFRLRRL
ncbi:MAG TPA: BatA domain-containing protein, partial [Pirellulales bacterium]